MVVFFNIVGLVWLGLAFALAVAIESLFKHSETSTRFCFLLGLFLLIFDAAWRYCRVRPMLAEAFEASKNERGLWKTPPAFIWFLSNQGGNLMLMPAWMFAILVIVFFGSGLI